MEMFRAQELLEQRATLGLDAAQTAELAALGVDDDLGFDLAAAAVDLATLKLEEMPPDVAARILGAATASDTTVMPVAGVPQTLVGFVPPQPIHTAPRPAEPPPPARVGPQAPTPPTLSIDAARLRRRSRVAVAFGVAGLLAAAAALLYVGRRSPAVVADKRSAADARAELLATAPDVTTLAWTATPDPSGAAAAGDVVWSTSAQKGFMRFTGLQPNDATTSQYQLWIFDKNRPEETPVDGGVFDVSSTGEVIIPITAKLPVGEPLLFAVTIEKPGGVVVSKRERIVVTAARG
jgi:hypothetical protein